MMQDEQIIELYFKRDEGALVEASDKYGNYCRSIAWTILNDEETAKECFNDTLYHSWQAIPPKRPNCLKTFLGKITRAIAMNRCREKHRKKREMITCELTQELKECIPGPGYAEEAIEADELRRLIETFLDTCTQEQQNIFVRRYWYCDSIKEIAKQYHLSQNKVKSMLFRMRKGLKHTLEEGGYHL